VKSGRPFTLVIPSEPRGASRRVIAIDTSSLRRFLSDEEGPDVDRVRRAVAAGQGVLPPVVLCEALSDPALPADLVEDLATLPVLDLHEGYWSRAGLLRARMIQGRPQSEARRRPDRAVLHRSRDPTRDPRPGFPHRPEVRSAVVVTIVVHEQDRPTGRALHRTTAKMTQLGTAAMPSACAFARIRSSSVRTASSGATARATRALAR